MKRKWFIEIVESFPILCQLKAAKIVRINLVFLMITKMMYLCDNISVNP